MSSKESAGNHQRQTERVWAFSMQALHGIGRATPRAFPAQHRGWSPRNAQSQQNPLFCGYDVTCAAPGPLIVQRRALCLCNADPYACPHARAIPIPLPWFHALGPPHLLFATCSTNTTVSKQRKIWIRELTRVKCGDLADHNHHANIHRAGGNQIFQTAQQNTAYPVHKI